MSVKETKKSIILIRKRKIGGGCEFMFYMKIMRDWAIKAMYLIKKKVSLYLWLSSLHKTIITHNNNKNDIWIWIYDDDDNGNWVLKYHVKFLRLCGRIALYLARVYVSDFLFLCVFLVRVWIIKWDGRGSSACVCDWNKCVYYQIRWI